MTRVIGKERDHPDGAMNVPKDRPSSRNSWLRRTDSQYYPVWFALILLIATSAVFVPATLSSSSISSMLAFASILAVAAVGETFVVRQGGFDLSMPGTISLAAVILTVVGDGGLAGIGLSLLLVILIAVVVGGLMGGLVLRGVNPIVATLSMSAITTGFAYQVSGGISRPSPKSITNFVNASVLGMPVLAIVTAVFIAVLAIMTTTTAPGRKFVAAGSNPEAARASAIRVTPHLVAAYILATLCYSVAGLLYAAYTVIPPVNIGHSYLLPAFAAVVIGGTPFTGGRGSVVATAVAAVFLTQLNQFIFALGAPDSVQLLVQSGALVIAALVRYAVERRRRTTGVRVSKRANAET